MQSPARCPMRCSAGTTGQVLQMCFDCIARVTLLIAMTWTSSLAVADELSCVPCDHSASYHATRVACITHCASLTCMCHLIATHCASLTCMCHLIATHCASLTCMCHLIATHCASPTCMCHLIVSIFVLLSTPHVCQAHTLLPHAFDGRRSKRSLHTRRATTRKPLRWPRACVGCARMS
jgi:hypothetical protein